METAISASFVACTVRVDAAPYETDCLRWITTYVTGHGNWTHAIANLLDDGVLSDQCV